MANKEERINALKESGEAAQVSADKQPPAELKKLGWARKKLLKDILECSLTHATKTEIAKLAKLFDISPKQMNIELALHLAQIEKAIKGDTPAYRVLMDRAYGHPVAPPMNNDNNMKIEIVYGNKPVMDVPHIDA